MRAHETVYDWVPVHQSFTGRELRGVYCVCGHDDYDDCVTANTEEINR